MASWLIYCIFPNTLAKQFCVILSDRNNDWTSKINYSLYKSSIGAWSVTYENCEPYLTIHIHKPQYKMFIDIIIQQSMPPSNFRLTYDTS